MGRDGAEGYWLCLLPTACSQGCWGQRGALRKAEKTLIIIEIIIKYFIITCFLRSLTVPSCNAYYYNIIYINGRFTVCQGNCCIHTSIVVKGQQI